LKPCSSPDIVTQNNGVFEFRVKNADGKEAWWTIDLKKLGLVKKGDAKSLGLKPDVTIILSDDTFVDIANGKLTGQKAFMTGALKTKGNMMLATKLDGLLKVCLLTVFGFPSSRRVDEQTCVTRAPRARRSCELCIHAYTYLRLIAIFMQ
jgi:putative sterol carrier protein